MGIGKLNHRRPPLPAPTESMGDENSAPETEVATTVTNRTDKTSYSIPEDGRPITISTQKAKSGKKSGSSRNHGRDQSQTSLLIEYFEASKTGDKSRAKPTVRVQVTSGTHKKTSSGSDAIQITGIGPDRKPSYTQRISLGNSSKNVKVDRERTAATDLSHSSGSNVSGPEPVEIEVLNDGSDVSYHQSARSLMYAPIESNISSMPPDSMLEGAASMRGDISRDLDYDDTTPTKDTVYLNAPAMSGSHSRNASQERITLKVMEKLGASPKPNKPGRSHQEHYDYGSGSQERRRRSSKSRRADDDTVSGAESSVLSSNPGYRPSSSQGSRMTNNLKLLEMVDTTIKRMILPAINDVKDDQRTDRKSRKYAESGRDSAPLERETVERRISKSSSSPNVSSKPKVVLNRDGEDPGTVLSRGDSERVKHRQTSRDYTERPSSRRSSGRHSREGSYDDVDQKVRHKSSRGSNTLRGAASAGLGAAALTSAALKNHDSQGDIHRRRKKRSKSRNSRSRSTSINEIDEAVAEIPPMPLTGQVNDSEVTRESILSQATDRPLSRSAGTPIREVSRGSVGDANSPISSRTPSRTPLRPDLRMSTSNKNIGSPASPSTGITNRARLAALTAAGLGGAAVSRGVAQHNVDADGYGDGHKLASPVQSVSSLRKHFEEDSLAPHGLRSHSAASRSSAGHLRSSRNSLASLRSTESPPTTTKLASSRKQSRDVGMEDDEAQFDAPEMAFVRSGTATPSGETADEWFERQHILNERYRDSFEGTTNRDSYQTNPFPQDEHRFTMRSDQSSKEDDDPSPAKDVRDIGANPNYIHTPVAVESAVASLMEPSTVGSHVLSSTGSPTKGRGSYSDRMAGQYHFIDEDDPAIYEGSTLSQTMTSQDRWAAIKGYAKNMSGSLEHFETQSPRQSPARSTREVTSFDKNPVMGTSGIPLADDPMPEIGHYDDSKSDVTTNPSIIQGPLGGDVTGKSTWPYTPEPEHEISNHKSHSAADDQNRGVLAAAAAGGGAGFAAGYGARQPGAQNEHELHRGAVDRDATPTGSPAFFRDEGYATDARTRSGGGVTPQPEHEQYSKKDLQEYQRAMDAQAIGDDDPFGAEVKHNRHFSGNSHGMDSPLYDSSTGKGMDHIQSKDIVALMDHLTVRDAQRNARDTEILTSLVRSAAEMRQSFDEMKKFIVEQDKLIMQNTDRGVEHTTNKVLSGPRPQPTGSPRTPRGQSEEDIQTKRKGVLQRVLKGLAGGKSGKDLEKIEGMLMQILDNVEDLKHQNGSTRAVDPSRTVDTLDSYTKLRNVADSGYEPEGRAGTTSTASPSGHLNVTPREKQQFHSGYDGRRGSWNRVSTVMEEDDDDELEPHESQVLNHQFENNERLMTPTQELYRTRADPSPNGTPPQPSGTYNTPEKQRKHKSTSSSLFGVPKISRWSRTTASSAAPDSAALDSPKQARYTRPESSRSRSTLDQYDDDNYDAYGDPHSRQAPNASRDRQYAAEPSETRSMRSQASRVTRTPSPLIPSEASSRDREAYEDEYGYVPSPQQEDDEAELDDPKYHAHRNSILLQHPQPRQGPTHRHQSALESQAHTFDDVSGTNSDLSQRTVSDFDPAVWGSSGTAGLARHRLSQVEPLSPVSMNSPASHGARHDNGPLVPQTKSAAPPKFRYDPEPEPESEWEPQYSNSGFSKAGYYSSPYGSGHLLEPIEEVRYSLETDSGRHMSPEPQIASAQAVDMRDPGRKITGPRPMGSRSPSAQAQPRLVDHSGTVRRKPVHGGSGSQDSFNSETF